MGKMSEVDAALRAGETVAGFRPYDNNPIAYKEEPKTVMGKDYEGLSDLMNPKDVQGFKKVPFWIVPFTGIVHMAMACLDGAIKYGPFNWRKKRVRASIYIDAITRHLAAYASGEDTASDSSVKHLGHIMACCNILLDAEHHQCLEDDRSISPQSVDLVNAMADHPLMKKLNAQGFAKV